MNANPNADVMNRRAGLTWLPLLIGALALIVRLPAAETTQWPISDAVNVFFSQLGGIASVEVADGKLLGKGHLIASKISAGGDGIPLYQGWGSVAGDRVEMKDGAGEVAVAGALGGGKTAEAPRQIEFTESYKKVADGVFLVHVEATFLTEASWSQPLSYELRFPAADYEGGSLLLVDQDGVEKTYPTDAGALPSKGATARKATFSKGAWGVIVEPSEETGMNIFDSREWGDDSLLVRVGARQPWLAPFSYPVGTKQTFEVKVAVRKSN
ncbi:MAG: hypothetical protein WC003_02240 [Terrimicrobiaceae bacterium]